LKTALSGGCALLGTHRTRLRRGLWLALGLGLLFLAATASSGGLYFGTGSWRLDLLLVAAGLVTALPLLWFNTAAQLLPLSTLGFLQYLSPTGQFLLAVLVYGEPLDRDRLIAFAFIWAALAIFTVDQVRTRARVARMVTQRTGGAERLPRDSAGR
jgi:chloramphenicol-sensitive protein RarD